MERLTANIATIPSRISLLPAVVNSLIKQVDEVNVMLNGHEAVPVWLSKLERVNCYLLDNSMGDGAKFMQQPDGYIFTCDDDLIYPFDYVSRCLRGLAIYGGIVSWHGKRIKKLPVERYDTKIWKDSYRCLRAVADDVRIDIPGTGVMAYHTSTFRADLSRFERRNMADIWVAIQAREQGIHITVLKHEEGEMIYLNPAGTIWDDMVMNPEQNSYICDQINMNFDGR